MPRLLRKLRGRAFRPSKTPYAMHHDPHNATSAPLAAAQVKPVVRCALRSAAHSHENRRRAKDLFWRWVGAKWPGLMPVASDLERSHLERRLPGRRLTVATDSDGAVWSAEVAYSEKDGTRTWTTRAVVADTGDADVLALQTACSGATSGPLVIAPPRLLGEWVERLELEDGGIAVIGEPRMVTEPDQLAAFCDHVLSSRRTLPVVALTNKPNSRYYGVDPRGVAEAVRGLAHVACLTPELAAAAAERLGARLVPVPGVPRIYAPNFDPAAAPKDHPLMRLSPAALAAKADDPGALRRLICARICNMSVSGA
jgi:hypothetical protein